ncbi:MAG: hypothetical protein GF411_19960 [Candidatus Lokiarchaeota archaeon]|nr:hypothetical protein [Candidatus Lokiarchaeota archaeon]
MGWGGLNGSGLAGLGLAGDGFVSGFVCGFAGATAGPAATAPVDIVFLALGFDLGSGGLNGSSGEVSNSSNVLSNNFLKFMCVSSCVFNYFCSNVSKTLPNYWELMFDSQFYMMESSQTEVEPMFPITFARSALTKTGYEYDLPLIGSGENGYAFARYGIIIKVTSDRGEYKIARRLLHQKIKHIINIYRAEYVNMGLDGMPPWWAEYWGDAMPHWHIMNNLYVIEKSRAKIPTDKTKYNIDKIINMIEMGISHTVIIKSFGELGRQIISLIDALSKYDVRLYDIRGDNIGLHDNMLKLIDTGGVQPVTA